MSANFGTIDKIRKESIFKEALKELNSMNTKEGFLNRLRQNHFEMYRGVIGAHDDIDKQCIDDNIGLGVFEKTIIRFKRMMITIISADLGGIK